MAANTNASLESVTDFAETPQGKYQYWSQELLSSEKMLKKWRKTGDRVVERYLGKRALGSEHGVSVQGDDVFKLNLFFSNVTTLASMLYGNTPKIDVSRRYAQADDDTGRVAAEIMERLLNLDMEENGAEIDAVLRSTLQDRLLPGLGCARVRYEMESETVPVEGAFDAEGKPFTQDNLISENASVEYLHWGDLSWGWARNWAEIPWIAYKNYLTKDEIEQRFGKHAADNIALKKQKMQVGDEGTTDDDTVSAWMKGEIWEIWNKKDKKVHWIALGYDKQLEEKDDPLQLSGFFPSPPFFIANTTTSLFIPRADFSLAQDLYNEVDALQTRISILTQAVKASGVYDSSADGVQRLLKEGSDNKLFPVENWALFSEKGGMQGVIQWMPLQDIVGALDKLIILRDQTIGLLQQITGMADIMRGDLGNQYEGVGQSEIKAKFGSIRVQALQDEFAQFASNLLQIKAEIIARHFNPETIFKQANLQASPDIELAQPAIELIKNPEQARIRISIRPESVAMTDFAQLKSERTEYLNALSMYMQSAAPLIEAKPETEPFLLQLLQWGLAGFKGASEIEGVVDKAIEASQKAAKEQAEQPEKPDPAVQLEQMRQKGKLAEIQAKAEADKAIRAQDLKADIETAQTEHALKIDELGASTQAKIGEIKAKFQADVTLEEIQSSINVQQAQGTAQAEVEKDAASTQIEIQKEAVKTQLKITEIAASSAAKIREAKAKPKPTTGEKK